MWAYLQSSLCGFGGTIQLTKDGRRCQQQRPSLQPSGGCARRIVTKELMDLGSIPSISKDARRFASDVVGDDQARAVGAGLPTLPELRVAPLVDWRNVGSNPVFLRG